MGDFKELLFGLVVSLSLCAAVVVIGLIASAVR